MFQTETESTTQENEQQDSVNVEIEAEIKGFFAEANLHKQIEEAKMLTGWNLNKTTYLHLTSFSGKYLSAPPFSVYSERLFSEAGNLYKQKRN